MAHNADAKSHLKLIVLQMSLTGFTSRIVEDSAQRVGRDMSELRERCEVLCFVGEQNSRCVLDRLLVRRSEEISYWFVE